MPQNLYNDLVSEKHHARQKDLSLKLVGYVTWAAVVVLGLTVLARSDGRWHVAALLLASFGLLMGIGPDERAVPWKRHLYLLAQAGLVAGLLFVYSIGWSFFAILFFILSAQAMTLFPPRVGAFWIGLFAVVTAGASVHASGWFNGLLILLPYVGGYLFFAAFARALARAEMAHRESQALLAELRKAHQQLQEYAARVKELAVAEERNRLARELHDTLGHRLTVAAVQLEGAQRLIPRDPERAAAMVGTVRQQVRQALSELRAAVAALRSPLEANLPVPDALARLATRFEEATGLEVHLAVPADLPALPEAHRLTLYRAAQEALTNVQRHADAHRVWIAVETTEGQITLTVSDDGRGLPPEAEERGFGLRGLRERAIQLGGMLTLGGRPGGGTQIHISLPLSETSDG